MTSSQPLRLSVSGRSMATACFGLSLLAFLDGLLPQLQMIATRGHVLLPTLLIKVCMAAVLLWAALWQWTAIRITSFIGLWLVTLVYLAADAIYLVVFQHTTPFDLMTGYNAYYGFFLMSPLAVFLFGEVDEGTMARLLTIAFWACFLVGIAQYFTQKPLLYTESVDGSFQVLAWESVEGSTRAFTFFTSGMGYGTFCCLIAGVAAARLLKHRLEKRQVLLLIASIFACYTTLTRNSYVQLAFTLIVVFCLSRRSLQRWAKYLPFVFLLAAVAIAVRSLGSESSDSALTSNLSTLIRAAEWQYYLSSYSAATPLQQLFGLGLIQNTNATNGVVFPIDSEFLAILMHIGLVGVSLIFWAQWKAWTWLYERACRVNSPFAIAVAGFWSTFLSVYFYNVALPTFSLVFLFSLFARAEAEESRATLSLGEAKLLPQPL